MTGKEIKLILFIEKPKAVSEFFLAKSISVFINKCCKQLKGMDLHKTAF